MRYKLQRMESCIRKNQMHLNSDRYCDQIKIVIECLDRVIEDPYTEAMYKELKSLYPDYKEDSFLEDLFNEDRRIVWLSDSGKKHIVFENPMTNKEKEPEGYSKEYRRLHHYYEMARFVDLKLAFYIMTPDIFSFEKSIEIRDFNSKIYKEKGYTEEAEKLIKRSHFGVFSWWD